MTLRTLLLTSALTLGLSAGLVAATDALAADKGDIRILNETKISLRDAISAAEKHHNNARALDASIDDDSIKPAYEVTVVDKDNRVFDVQVDGVSGDIIGSREDIDD